MSYENNTGDDFSMPTQSDLSGWTGNVPNAQFRFVKDDGSGNAVLAAAATDLILGVLQNNPKGSSSAPRTCEIRPVGISKVVAGAAVASGQAVTSDANGRAVPAAPGNQIGGYAREAASGAGTVIAISCARSSL